MNRRTILILLLASFSIVVLATLFSSADPDGLNKVAEVLGFKQKEAVSPSVFIDHNYDSAFMYSGMILSVLIGLIEIIFIYLIFRVVGSMISRFSSKSK